MSVNNVLEIIHCERTAFNEYFLDGIAEWSYIPHEDSIAIYRYATQTKIIYYDDIMMWYTNKNLMEFINAKDRK